MVKIVPGQNPGFYKEQENPGNFKLKTTNNKL
jgi:hypothetical protein